MNLSPHVAAALFAFLLGCALLIGAVAMQYGAVPAVATAGFALLAISIVIGNIPQRRDRF